MRQSQFHLSEKDAEIPIGLWRKKSTGQGMFQRRMKFLCFTAEFQFGISRSLELGIPKNIRNSQKFQKFQNHE